MKTQNPMMTSTVAPSPGTIGSRMPIQGNDVGFTPGTGTIGPSVPTNTFPSGGRYTDQGPITQLPPFDGLSTQRQGQQQIDSMMQSPDYQALLTRRQNSQGQDQQANQALAQMQQQFGNGQGGGRALGTSDGGGAGRAMGQGIFTSQDPRTQFPSGDDRALGFPPLPPGGFPPPGGPSNTGQPPMTGETPPAQPGARAPNINQTAATGINDSIAGARREMNYQPGYISPQQSRTSTSYGQGYQAAGANGQGYRANTNAGQGYQAAGQTAQGFDAAGVDSQGYNATNAGSQGYGAVDTTATGYGAERLGSTPTVGANNVQTGLLANQDLSSYMNQYDNAVVDNTLSDLDRARQIQGQTIGANATAAGAFGGSRHALREAENNRNFYEQAADTSAQLRQSGFNNAQQMGLTDIGNTMQANLANQGANLQANSLTANLSQQGNMANQSAANQAAQFGAQSQNQAGLANQAAQNRASEFGSSAANTAALTNAAAANQASQFGAAAANQAAMQASQQQQQAAMFGAQASNAASSANQQALNQARQFGSQALNTSGLANQQALNQAGQFGAQAGNTANLANQSSLNQARQFGSQARNTSSLANAQARNNMGQFNAQQRQAAQMANQNAGLAGSQQRLNAGNQLGNLSNLGFGMGQTVNRNMAQDGAMKQGLNQLLIDAARNQFNQYTNQPYKDTGLISAALGQAPVPQTTTTSKNPGLFDYLTLGASMSDMRLKTNINQVGNLPNGLGIYTWDWTEDAVNKGLANDMHIGVLAQEVAEVMPEAVVHTPSGYMAVKYGELLKEF